MDASRKKLALGLGCLLAFGIALGASYETRSAGVTKTEVAVLGRHPLAPLDYISSDGPQTETPQSGGETAPSVSGPTEGESVIPEATTPEAPPAPEGTTEEKANPAPPRRGPPEEE